MRTAVIVIGDLGRSPRMQYHAASLAAAGSEVDLIGLEGAALMPALAADPRVRVHRLSDRAFAGRSKGGVRRFVYGSLARGIGQGITLFSTRMRIAAGVAIDATFRRSPCHSTVTSSPSSASATRASHDA